MANRTEKKKPYEPGSLAVFNVIGVVLSILGVVSLLSVVGGLQGQTFEIMKRVMQGLGGSLCIGISVLLIWGGALCLFATGRDVPKRGYVAMTVLFLAALGIFNLLSYVGQENFMEAAVTYNNTQYSPPLAEASGYWNMITAAYHMSAATGFFGGALGMLLAWPSWTYLRATLGVVALALVCILCVFLITQFDFQQLWEAVKSRSRERKEERSRRRAQEAYEQQQYQARQEAEAAEESLLTPAFLRRKKKRAERLEEPAEPVQQTPYAPYVAPYGQAYYPQGFPMTAQPCAQPAPAAPQSAFQPWQPELYNEIVMPSDSQPLWRAPAKAAKQERTGRSPFSAPPSYPSPRIEDSVEPAKEPEGDAVILSASKRRALERIEEIRKRKAEINAELSGNQSAMQTQGDAFGWEESPAGESAAPAQSFPTPTFAPAASFQEREEPASEAADRSAAYRRPVPREQESGPIPFTAAATVPVKDVPRKTVSYTYPPIELLNLEKKEVRDTRAHDTENAVRLEKTLESFNIPAQVQRVTHGPAVTRFELGLLSSGVNVKRIMSIADNIALDLAANGGVRIEIPIPGTTLFGIEVPNKEIQAVSLSEVLLSEEMQNAESPLTVALGRDVAGKPVLCDLARMPHLLIAGQTGSGKSVCINAIVNSLLYRTSPEEVRMIMIDPKVVELQCYNVVPHLLIPVVSDPKKAAGALKWAVSEMLARYHKMQKKNVREISAYNAKLGPDEEKLPRIVIVIDELADLMLACKKDVEDSIIRLAQLSRAAGIHMVVATQRPTVNVITGLIKANIPSRIAFAVSSSIDSRTILDQNGAEKLLGRGDMFYFPTGASAPLRVQGCFLSDAETERVMDFIAEHSQTDYDVDVIEALEESDETVNPLDDGGDEDSGVDERLAEAIEMAVTDGQTSISMLQRRMKIGYARAGRLIDEMANRGIVTRSAGTKAREVLITREEYEKIKETLH